MARRRIVGAVAGVLVLLGLGLAYNRHAMADLLKTDFDEVQLRKRHILVKGSERAFTGTLQVRGKDIATLGAAIFANTPVEQWTRADPQGLILEVTVVDGQLSGSALLFADLRSELASELKSGLRFTLAKWFSPRQKVASATFVASKLEGTSALWRPVGPDMELRKFVTAEFQGNLMHGKVLRFHDNGKIQSELLFERGAPSGTQKEHYASGELEREIRYQAKGLDHKAYYRNGQLRRHWIEEEGELRSEKRWFPDGSQEQISNLQNGVPLAEKRWYSNGQLAYELQEIGPLEYPPSGLIREYHDSGALKSEHNYVAGVLDGPFAIYYANENLWEEGSYARGKRDGAHRKWWKNGTKALESTWSVGQQSGSYERWYASGKLWEKADYQAGARAGSHIKRWKNGELAHELHYVDGQPEGPYMTFYDNGQARLEATYRNGKLDGEYRNWLKDGTVYELATYENGTKIQTSLPQ